MKPFRLEVVYRSDDYTKQLEADNKALCQQIEKLKAKVNELEFHYSSLYSVDMQLADLLRAHGVDFRDITSLANPSWR